MQSDMVSAAKWFGFCLITASLILALGINVAVMQRAAPTTSTVRLHLDSLPDVRLRSVPGADTATFRVQFTDTTPKK